MTTNKKSQNAWVQDLNNSVKDIKKKERNIKFFRYFGLFTTYSILVFIVFILGKSKLQVVNPKLKFTEAYEPLIIKEKVELPEIKKPTPKPIKSIDTEEKSKEKKNTVLNIDNHLDKNRPNKSLNKGNSKKLNASLERNGKHITYYDNGNKWVELNFEDGLREGVQFTWHRNGKLKSELNYVAGKKHGIQKWWQIDGKILNEKVYIHGEWQKN